MRRLRVEQYNRYFAQAGEDYSTTMDDTIPEEEEEAAPVDTGHRNYDEQVLFFIYLDGEGGVAMGGGLRSYNSVSWGLRRKKRFPDGGDAAWHAFPRLREARPGL